MRYRKLDANGDMTFGRSAANFWQDVPEAPAQAVRTRLALRLGEWFLDTTDGTPYATQILGKHTAGTRDAAIRERIVGTEGVTSIEAYASTFDPNTRSFTVQATISTQFGAITVTAPL